MPKIVSFIIVSGLILTVLVVFNINNVNAREETKFVQFSVLAEERADYGVDENSSTIPAVSIDIIEDKLHDSGVTSTIPVIKYKYLPPQTPKTAKQNNDEAQTVDQSEPHHDHENNGNAGGNQNQNDNGNGGSNQNNGKDKGTKPDKGSSSNGSTNSGNNSSNSSNSDSNANAGSKGSSSSQDK